MNDPFETLPPVDLAERVRDIYCPETYEEHLAIDETRHLVNTWTGIPLPAEYVAENGERQSVHERIDHWLESRGVAAAAQRSYDYWLHTTPIQVDATRDTLNEVEGELADDPIVLSTPHKLGRLIKGQAIAAVEVIRTRHHTDKAVTEMLDQAAAFAISLERGDRQTLFDR